MRGRPRIPRGTASEILAAINEAAAIPAPSPTPMDVEQLRTYHEAIAHLREILEAEPLGPTHLAWRWRQMGSIAAELDFETVKLLQRAGVAR